MAELLILFLLCLSSYGVVLMHRSCRMLAHPLVDWADPLTQTCGLRVAIFAIGGLLVCVYSYLSRRAP